MNYSKNLTINKSSLLNNDTTTKTNMLTDIHEPIKNTLDNFIKNDKIPNLIFHGPTGSGKRSIVNNFIEKIYNNDANAIKQYVLYVECAHGKGIKFIRDELKFFAKSHINIKSTDYFKIVVMDNADNLTIDAQSALRRCIEVYNHTTRFFIIIENKYKLLKPILSRFCHIYIYQPYINSQKTNLNIFNKKDFICNHNVDMSWLSTIINKKSTSQQQIMNKAIKIYEKGFSCLEVMKYVEDLNITNDIKWSILLVFNKIKKEFRNEILLIYFILNNIYFRLDECLENILIM